MNSLVRCTASVDCVGRWRRGWALLPSALLRAHTTQAPHGLRRVPDMREAASSNGREDRGQILNGRRETTFRRLDVKMLRCLNV
eukprot:200196-Chlamydomonas_euryale.AAC.3